MNLSKIVLFVLAGFMLNSCNNKPNKRINNTLKNAKSLYLQMHANNPVNWHIYSNNIWEKAAHEKKLVLLSFGYSACHWCRVMEKENFEDTAVAHIMNTYYYNVKIDREEYPDLDNLYANKQKKLIGWAGWPMHFILNPQKQIIWTGIYLPKNKWKANLKDIAISYAKNHNFRKIVRKEEYPIKESTSFNQKKIYKLIFSKLDTLQGGLIPTHYSRKYPNAGLLSYLLSNYCYNHKPKIAHFIQLTLDKMYRGGIFDQVEGGFFRFSMDENWHIPHFEKMLYTNALLADLYANAYKIFKKESYKQAAVQSIQFILKNLSSRNSLLYGSLNADTKDEGIYYVFQREKLKQILAKNYSLAFDYYGFADKYLWKEHYVHLQILQDDSSFCLKHHLQIKNWKKIKEQINLKLKEIRAKQTKPTHDNKLITSWNSLLIGTLSNIYQITNNKYYLLRAEAIARVLSRKFKINKFKHYYLTNDNSFTHKALSSDYLYLCNALVRLYQTDFSEKYLFTANDIFKSYLAKKNSLLNFPNNDEPLPDYITMENKIAKALNFYFKTNYSTSTINIDINHPENYGYYLTYLLKRNKPRFELVIAPIKNNFKFEKKLFPQFYPNLLILFANKKSKLINTKTYKTIDEQESFYLCRQNYCYSPTNKIDSIIYILKCSEERKSSSLK